MQSIQALGSVLYEQEEQVEWHRPDRTDQVAIENEPPELTMEMEMEVLLLSWIIKTTENR